MWTQAEDGSVIDQNGRVIFFSEQRFVEDICLGDCCFICGAAPGAVPFSDEHVLPEWLLRRYNLFDRTIELPNGHTVRYDRYTVPCCVACNDLLGEKIEKPISEITRRGTEATIAFLKANGNLEFFVWMGLIYLKTHLKDRAHRLHLDARQGDGKIADAYDWTLLHQLHSIVRCFCVSCAIDTGALGSFLVLQIEQTPGFDRFDFGDLYAAQTMMLRLDDLGLITVFNDACGVQSFYLERLERMTGPLSEVQFREVMVEMAFLNLHLKNRPYFDVSLDLMKEKQSITVTLPKLELADLQMPLRGALFQQAFKDGLPDMALGRSPEDVAEMIKAGKLTFLFDDQGQFIKSGIRPLDPPPPS